MQYSLFLSISVLLAGFGNAGKLPSTFPICKRNDPDFNNCFKLAIEKCLPLLRNEILELGLPAIEPMDVERVSVGAEGNAISLKQTLRNGKMYGLVDSKINKTEVTLGPEQLKAVVYVYVPTILFKSEYEMEGKVLVLPLSGKGNCTINSVDLQVVVTIIGEYTERKGKTHAKLQKLLVRALPGGATFQFDNLFNGDQRLGSEINKLLNDNWKELYQDVRKAFEDAIAHYIGRIFDRVFERVPYNELFPVE